MLTSLAKDERTKEQTDRSVTLRLVAVCVN